MSEIYAIDVEGLSKGYDVSDYAVEDINLKVEKGTIHGLIGRNGAGKTTIIKCLAGIYPPDKGTVKINGKESFYDSKAREDIGYIADSNQMFKNYSIKKMAKFFQGIYESFDMDDFEKLCEKFELDKNKKIKNLSKGYQMRASFVLNMARNPKVLIMDEPTAGLDPIAKKDLIDTIVCGVEHRDMTVLISSHLLEELEKICDSVTMIRDGKVDIESDVIGFTEMVKKYQVVFLDIPKDIYDNSRILDLSNVGSVYYMVVNAEYESFEEDMKKAGATIVEEIEMSLEESFIYINKAGKKEASR